MSYEWVKQIPHPIYIVAEVKDQSPFGWKSSLSKREMMTICESMGDAISIHTNPLWGGSWEWLEEARKLTTKPILAKGFHDTICDVNRAFDCGADYCLTVGWWPGDPRCWHECESLLELKETGTEWAVWNSRDPRTGNRRHASIHDARKLRQGKLCQASGIKRAEDIGDCSAVLIGEGLYR